VERTIGGDVTATMAGLDRIVLRSTAQSTMVECAMAEVSVTQAPVVVFANGRITVPIRVVHVSSSSALVQSWFLLVEMQPHVLFGPKTTSSAVDMAHACMRLAQSMSML